MRNTKVKTTINVVWILLGCAALFLLFAGIIGVWDCPTCYGLEGRR